MLYKWKKTQMYKYSLALDITPRVNGLKRKWRQRQTLVFQNKSLSDNPQRPVLCGMVAHNAAANLVVKHDFRNYVVKARRF